MRFAAFFALSLFCLIAPGIANAVNVIDVQYLDDLKTCCTSNTNANVRQFSSTITSGGGQFFAGGASNCTDATDEGVIIKETTMSKRCWYRQFSGPVHLTWYGVADAAVSGCYGTAFSGCDATTALNAAFAAAAVVKGLGGDGGVTTDGRSIAILGDVTIPEKQYLTCSGTPGGARDQAGDNPYWVLPNSIVLDPAHTLVRSKQSRLSDCMIRPTWYVQQSSPFNIPAGSASDLVKLVRKFTGLATSCQGKNCPMEDVFIIGFDTCEDNDQSLKSVLSDLQEECLVDEWIHNNGGGMKLQNFTGRPYLEGSYDDSIKHPHWDIVNVALTGTDSVKVTIDGAGDNIAADDLSSAGGDVVLIDGLEQGTSVAPVSANGRWLTTSVSQVGTSSDYDVILTGASWVGPTDSYASWKAATSVITVLDTTNIIAGQYACASGTPPFCTQPSGFTATYIVSSDINSLGMGTGNVHLSSGTLAGWPVSGIVQVTSEEMTYTIIDSGTVAITARGVNNTGNTTHLNTEHIVPAAPRVVGVVPTSEAVIVSAVAQSACASSCGNVTFANDTGVRTGTGIVLGTLTFNPGYHTWTANANAGGNPSSTLVVIGNAGSSSSTITIAKSCWKVQPGMTVEDLSASHITAGTTVSSVDCSTNTIHISQPTTGTIVNEKMRFAGCGYPAGSPWLGNCASTTLLLGGTGNVPPPDDNEEEAQGPTCEYIHSFGNEIQVHIINAPTTDCTNFVIAGGGGVGDQLDPDSVGIWFEGNATKTQFTNGRIAGAVVSILDVPNPQSSGIGISNAEVPGHIIVGPDSDLVLTGLHGNAPSGDFVYVPGSIASLQAAGISLPAWTVYFDDPAVFPRVYCTGNAFASPMCSQVKTTPTCGSGCTSVSGADSDFDVTTTGSGSSFTVMLAANYPAKPICRVTPGATGAGASVSASISSIAWQPYGTTLTFKTSAAVTHLYGSCHCPTG